MFRYAQCLITLITLNAGTVTRYHTETGCGNVVNVLIFFDIIADFFKQ